MSLFITLRDGEAVFERDTNTGVVVLDTVIAKESEEDPLAEYKILAVTVTLEEKREPTILCVLVKVKPREKVGGRREAVGNKLELSCAVGLVRGELVTVLMGTVRVGDSVTA